MDCDLDEVDLLMKHLCETEVAECILHDERGEWIVRIEDRIYVLVIPEDVKPK
jgi:hypothetical protein